MMKIHEITDQIRNERIQLRPLQESDASLLCDAFEPELNEDGARKLVLTAMAARQAGTMIVLGIVSDGELRGYLDLHDLREDSAAIGYRIRRPYRESGYAKDAVYLTVHWLMENTDLAQIRASAADDNDASVAILTHNGFELQSAEENVRYYLYRRKAQSSSEAYLPPDGQKVIYAAGGCFWGTEKVFRALEGVTETVTGYANGHTADPKYEDVCRNDTGFKEAVRITYDPSVISLEVILEAYFLTVDPTVRNRQGHDIGTQYQTGIYYTDPVDLPVLEKIFTEQRKLHTSFFVELGPLENFYEAEEYHQKYLEKHPDGYCHISFYDMEQIRRLNQRNREKK